MTGLGLLVIPYLLYLWLSPRRRREEAEWHATRKENLCKGVQGEVVWIGGRRRIVRRVARTPLRSDDALLVEGYRRFARAQKSAQHPSYPR